MPTSPTPDDLLALARFLWPGLPWQADADASGDTNFVYALTMADARHSDKWEEHARNFEDCADVAAAEAVLIERGLGIRYIRQLAKALRFVPAPDGHRYSETDAMILATAPLDARVRAMVEVVRQHEHARGNSAKGETKETP